jgi:hypothetical protein
VTPYTSLASAEKHWITQKSDDGSVLVLENGSVWKTSDTADSSLWMNLDDVILVDNEKIINTDERGETIDVECISQKSGLQSQKPVAPPAQPIESNTKMANPPSQTGFESAQALESTRSQYLALKTIYETPLDRLEEMFAGKTAAEITQIKSEEYLRREALRNSINAQKVIPADKSQVADLIRSEENFDHNLETIRQNKVKAESRQRKKSAVVGYINQVRRNIGRQSSQQFTPIQSTPALQPIQPISQAAQGSRSPVQFVNVNGQSGTIMSLPGMTTYSGPAFSNY